MEKRIVICCDGTWNQPIKAKTNVQKMWSAVAPAEVDLQGLRREKTGSVGDATQFAFYESGIGTNPFTQFWPLFGLSLAISLILFFLTGSLVSLAPVVLVVLVRAGWSLVPGAFGVGMTGKITNAYGYVVDNYEPGAELYFFGFSRGAFTVRSTVGMIRKCGVLRLEERALIKDAYRLYRARHVRSTDQLAKDFRTAHSVLGDQETPIKFIGVWDTVGALGVPVNAFSAFIWNVLSGVAETVAMLPLLGTRLRRGVLTVIAWVEKVPLLGDILHLFMPGYYQFHDVALSRSVANAYQALAVDEKRRSFAPTLWEQHPEPGDQRLEQRWFAGVHSDIGGGMPDPRQSDRTLLWIAEKAAACGLIFQASSLPIEYEGETEPPLSESFAGFFRLVAGPYVRPVGQGVAAADASYFGSVSRETVDVAAMQRELRDATYKPSNLIAYYRAFPGIYQEHVAALKGKS